MRSNVEHDIQSLILNSLGIEAIRVATNHRTGMPKVVRTGIYVSKDKQSYFWRCNSGTRFYDGKDGSKNAFKAAPAGTADILGVVRGVPVAIEVKKPGEKQRDVQEIWQQIHEAAGGRYCLAESMAQAKQFVRSIEVLQDLARRLASADIQTVNFLEREYPYEGFARDVGSSDEGEQQGGQDDDHVPG